MNEVRRFVPRNLRDDGMIEAHEVAHYTHLNLSQYVSASDYDALAARVQAVERDNRTYIDERHELLTKNEALIQQLADQQVARLREALTKLCNEVSGLLGLQEEELRNLVGHSNVGCLKERLSEGKQALRETGI